jgi:hypothetical protein
MFEIATTIIVLALGMLTFLVARTVLRGKTRIDRPPQTSGEPVETRGVSTPYGGLAVPGSPVAGGLDAIRAADKHFATSGISSQGQRPPTRRS